jgi:hypothetical protein
MSMPRLVSLRLLTWVSHSNLAAFKILKLLFKLFQCISNHEHPQHNRSQPYWFLTMALFKVLCQYCLPTDGVWTGEPPIHKLAVETTCDTQNKCTRKMDGAHDRPSTEVILPMAKLPTMTGRVHILQVQFLYRSLHVPEDTLISRPRTSCPTHQRIQSPEGRRRQQMPIENRSSRTFRAQSTYRSTTASAAKDRGPKLFFPLSPTIGIDPSTLVTYDNSRTKPLYSLAYWLVIWRQTKAMPKTSILHALVSIVSIDINAFPFLQLCLVLYHSFLINFPRWTDA